MELVLQSTITCPVCQHNQTETMPTDACRYFYQCVSCSTVLKPKAGEAAYFALRRCKMPTHTGTETLLLIARSCNFSVVRNVNA